MTRLLITIGLMVALLGANAWQYQQIQDQSAKTAVAEKTASDRLATITQLKSLADERNQAERTLADQQLEMRATLSQREQRIKELQRENQQYRDWAANQLPDTTQRLRQRPAITSARDYQQWLLSQPDTLPAARNSPDNQRRPE